MKTTSELFLEQIHEFGLRKKAKITIVGVGRVGSACAYALLQQKVASELCLIDKNADKVKGELMDLQHAAALTEHGKIYGGTNYSLTADSKICIITASAPTDGKDRETVWQENADIIKDVTKRLIDYNPFTILLVVTDPVDIMTRLCCKISMLPQEHVIGTGTSVDSARFQYLLSQRFNVSPESCQGWIIGGHSGDTRVAVWSSVRVGGARLIDLCPEMGKPNDAEGWNNIFQQVKTEDSDFNRWAISLTVANLCRCIVYNEQDIYPLSVCVRQKHGIQQDIYMSLPSLLGEQGIDRVLYEPLSQDELQALHASAEIVWNWQKNIRHC